MSGDMKGRCLLTTRIAVQCIHNKLHLMVNISSIRSVYDTYASWPYIASWRVRVITRHGSSLIKQWLPDKPLMHYCISNRCYRSPSFKPSGTLRISA